MRIWLSAPPTIAYAVGGSSEPMLLPPKSEWQGAQQRCHGGHHDGAEAQQARFLDRIPGGFRLTFGGDGKIDHHDAVFLDDADQEDDADEGITLKSITEKQRQQRTDPGRGQRRKDRDGVDVAFIQDAQDDVDRDQRGQRTNFERERPNEAAVPGNPSVFFISFRAASMASVASPSDGAGSEVRDDRKPTWMINC